MRSSQVTVCHWVIGFKCAGFDRIQGQEFVGNADSIQLQRCQGMAAVGNQMDLAIEQSQLYRQLAIVHQKLPQLATTNGLTGIANRRQSDRVFRLEWRRLAREQLLLSLIMFDIDFFKLYNQFSGHVGGDDCWCWRCRGDRHNCQAGWGFDRPLGSCGEEFAVVLANTSAEGANVTLSCDSATRIPSAQESPDTLILRADSALYQAKTQGKNRICHASSN